MPGNEHECPVLYELVDRFVHEVGDDVIRRLILDRGFLDGARIAHCKLQHGIDILIPVRKDMDVYEDALGLLQLKKTRFKPYRRPNRESVDPPRLPHSPEHIRKRELKRRKTVEALKQDLPAASPQDVLVRSEVTGLRDLRSFSSCSVPLSVIVSRDLYADGHWTQWMLLDTKPLSRTDGPCERRTEYAVRTEIEEGHRQHKCFWDMAQFTSRAFSLVLNQIVFALLAYNLLQIFLRSKASPPLSRRSRPRQLNLLATTAAVIIIYAQNRFATLTPAAYSEMLLTLEEESRLKVLKRLRRLREEFSDLGHPRPP